MELKIWSSSNPIHSLECKPQVMGEGYKIFQPRFFLSQKRHSIRADTIGGSDNLRDVEIVKGEVDNDNDEDSYTYSNSSSNSRSLSYLPNTPLPKPPAGFVVDESGRVLMASDKRIVTIVSDSFS